MAVSAAERSPAQQLSTWEEVGLAVVDCRQQRHKVRLQCAWQHQLQRRYKTPGQLS